MAKNFTEHVLKETRYHNEQVWGRKSPYKIGAKTQNYLCSEGASTVGVW